MSTVKKISEGLYLIADTYVNKRDYVYPSIDRRSSDNARLSSDVRVVGNDMKKAITKHGQRAYKSSSN